MLAKEYCQLSVNFWDSQTKIYITYLHGGYTDKYCKTSEMGGLTRVVSRVLR